MIRTILWFLYFWLYLLVCIPMTIQVWLLERRGKTEEADRWTRRYVQNWARRLLWMAGAKVTVEGAEHLPQGAAVYIANHQGYFDIPLLLGYMGEPHGIMAKKEVDKLPGIRTWMRHLHCLFVNRDSAASGATVFREGQTMLQQGYSLTIFPEGTRNRGGALREFKAGAFRIATLAGVPIVPVTIDGTHRLMEANHMLIRPAKVRMVIHPPIETAGLSRAEVRLLPEQVRAILEESLAR